MTNKLVDRVQHRQGKEGQMETRQNGSNGWVKWLSLIGLVSTLIALGGAWASQRKDVCTALKINEDHETRLRVVENAVLEQRGDLKWIRAKLEER